MYISKLGHPVPEFATIEKTFIPEPIIPVNSDDLLVALLPLSRGSVVLTIVDPPDIERAYEYAESEELPSADIDWAVVNTAEMDAIVSKHLLKYLKDYLNAALNDEL